MCKVNYVLLVLKSVRPRQSIIIACVLPLHGVLIVANVSASSLPAFSLLCCSLRVDKWTHSMVVQTVRFHQVDDVETIGFACFCVADPEIEPLGVSTCVVVWLKDQIVFILIDLDRSSKIAAFKSGFEKQRTVLR